jgi:hypothetical protein
MEEWARHILGIRQLVTWMGRYSNSLTKEFKSSTIIHLDNDVHIAVMYITYLTFSHRDTRLGYSTQTPASHCPTA